MPTLTTINGLSVAVELPPPGTRARRPPVLFIHGLLGGAWYFEKYQRFFALHGYATYAVNLRGRAGSRPVADIGRVTLEEFVQDALDVADALDRPVVVGHSMGGLIAQKLGERGAARALVLLCPAPPGGIPFIGARLLVRQLKYLPRILSSRPLRGSFADDCALTLNRVPAAEREALHARFIGDSGRAGREMSFGALRVDAERVTCPVLVVSGSDDRFVPPRIARSVAAKYGAPYREYLEHAHFIVWEPGWERPARDVEHWLDRTLVLGGHETPGDILLETLARQRGKRVELRFLDGHVVRAKLIAVEFEEPSEIIYEVHQVLNVGPSELAAVYPGKVAAASLDALGDFQLLMERGAGTGDQWRDSRLVRT